jgi:hypothetical protein
VLGVGYGAFRKFATGTYLSASLLPDFGFPGEGSGYTANLLTGIGRSARLATMSFKMTKEQPLNGDYNHNNVVDAADYVVWRKTDGTQQGYNTWRTNFGRTSGGGTAIGSNSTVPEPLSGSSLIIAVAVGATWTRHRWH